MQNNEKQLKGIPGENLPVVSDNEQVQKNSMRLYIYLINLSHFCGKNKPREFSQRDFTVNNIHEALGMHQSTIKKYWKILEDNGLIKYEGSQVFSQNQKDWDKYFTERKKNKAGFYTIPKREPYRIIPRETINKMQNQLEVSEIELKLYLLLANMQEHFCFMGTTDRSFTLADLRELLKMSKQVKNNKEIYLALLWLKEIGAIDFSYKEENCNTGDNFKVFTLNNVAYYLKSSIVKEILENRKERINKELKDSIINRVLLRQTVEF